MIHVAVCVLLAAGCTQGAYLGREVGALSELHHGVRGRVYAVDSRTLYLHDFHYDGEGPAAYFYVGTSKSPSASGSLRLRDERGGGSPLRKYRGESVTLSLPEGKTLRDVAWFAVWCDEYSINFGSVDIPRSLEYPRPAKVGALRGVHGVSSDPIVVVDAQTLLVPNFSYDGEAPDAKFWVGRGEQPSPQGIRIPDENGKEAPLRRYDRKTIVLTLPGELTVFDIGHFAVWCEAFTVNFGHVVLPRAALANVPPSLKMLGVSPQSRNQALAGEAHAQPPRPRARHPLARLDATTYRPHLRAGPSPAAERTVPRAHHRREDARVPPPQQLLDDQQQQEAERQTYNQQEQQQRETERQSYNQQEQQQREAERQSYNQQEQQQQEAERQSYNQQEQQKIHAHQQQTELQSYNQENQDVQDQTEPTQTYQENQGVDQSKQNQQVEQQRYESQQDIEQQNYNEQNQGKLQTQNEQNQNLEQQRESDQQEVNQHADNHQLQETQPLTVEQQNQLLEQQLNYINQLVLAHNPKIYETSPRLAPNVYQPNSQYQLDQENYYLQNGQVLSTQDLMYQQQLYEQQRRALELELQRYQQAKQLQAEPLQYRLLPYNYQES